MVALTVRLVISLAVVVGLLLLTARLGSRRFRSTSGAAVRVVHRQALSRTSSIAVIEVGSRTLLVGTTEHQVNLLTDLTGDLPPAPAVPAVTVAPGATTAAHTDTDEVATAATAATAAFAPQLAAALADRADAPSSSVAGLRLAPPLPDLTDPADRVPHQAPPVLPAAAQVVPAAPVLPRPRPAGAHRRPGAHSSRRRPATGPAGAPVGPLSGSVLSMDTWRQAVSVARGRTR